MQIPSSALSRRKATSARISRNPLWWLLALAFVYSIEVAPALAQVPVVVQGRVEDASSRLPVAGARVFSADSSSAVLTDSLGGFVIQLPTEDSLAVNVERIGYLSQRFDLAKEASRAVSVLLLEPAALVLEGVTVTSEAAVSTLDRNIRARRNSFWGPVRAFDRSWLDRFAFQGGSVYDMLRAQLPRMHPCGSDKDQICVPGRRRSFRTPYPEVQYLVCVDGRRSVNPFTELQSLWVESVALVEILVGNRIAVYTPGWILSRARRGRTTVPPLIMGC